MAASVIRFPRRRQVVFLDPVPDDGGSWGVFSQRPGHPPTLVTTRFAFPAAETAAREIAAQLGADLLDDAPPEPRGAA